MQLVDEQHDLARRFLHFFQHGLEALFELAAVLGARDERAHIQGHDALVLEPFRHIAADDALRQAFHNRGLADPGLADQHRVIFRAARQHLDHAADLLVAPDDRVELALRCQLGEIAAVALQGFIGGFGIL